MKSRAFTLIELLIVVAIIAILAAIAIPNFLTAQTRAKVAHVESNFQALAVAMEAYYADWQSYQSEDGLIWDGWLAFNRLTTPIPYIAKMPLDVFKADIPGMAQSTELGFYNLGTGSTTIGIPRNRPMLNGQRAPTDAWMLASYGPDLLDDTTLIQDYPRTRKACPYDPTNGTKSKGDLYRFWVGAHGHWIKNFEQEANPQVAWPG
jgi:general secretion pathway protein G